MRRGTKSSVWMMWRPSRRTSFSSTYLVMGRFGRKMPSLGSCKGYSSRRRKAGRRVVCSPPFPPLRPPDFRSPSSGKRPEEAHGSERLRGRAQLSRFWTASQPLHRNSLSVFVRVSREPDDQAFVLVKCLAVVLSCNFGKPPVGH